MCLVSFWFRLKTCGALHFDSLDRQSVDRSSLDAALSAKWQAMMLLPSRWKWNSHSKKAWVVGWLGGWVVGWLGGWVVGWLGGWVVGWFRCVVYY